MDIYTKHEIVNETVAVWAVPRGPYDAVDSPPFSYKFQRSYRDGEVKVCEQLVSIAVPAGINLIVQSIETLELKRKEAFDTYQELSNKITTKINQLKLLSGPSTKDNSIVASI